MTENSASRNVHVIGIGGSGKTTLARWCAREMDLALHDLDAIVWPEHRELPSESIEREIEAILCNDGWVTEGVYVEPWVEPLLARAQTIVWLDVGVATCLARMLKRHVHAELTRTNKHPGWRQLFRFMNYTRTSAAPQRRRIGTMLELYAGKVVRCRTTGDVGALQSALLARADRRLVDDYGGTTTNSSPS